MKSKIHVIIPNTTEVLCGAPSHYMNALYREQVTCKNCRKHPDFKQITKPMSSQLSKECGYRKK
ncbi:MAG: hypothetical protein KAS32_24230 [Candidatus Peribacteraceae bacterium]|nr:hypothetical protein [Candidatus Peribacteraceae bacterium]